MSRFFRWIEEVPPAARLLSFAVALSLLLNGCAASKKWRYLPTTKAEERTIYVINHGWHTGIAVAKEDLGEAFAFLDRSLPPGRYYEFGWGEAEFYQADKITASVLLRAIFFKNPSVMEVMSVPALPDKYFTQSEVVELNLSETGLSRLKKGLLASFKLDPDQRPYPLKKGSSGLSRFFRGEESYVITHTCNSWTASLLQDAGLPMDSITLRAASVMHQVKEAKKAYACCPGKVAPAPAGSH